MNAARLLLCVTVSMSASLAAADPLAHALSPRRQLSACMTKYMAASRTLSYNDAAKRCKAELSQADLKAQRGAVVSQLQVKPPGNPAP